MPRLSRSWLKNIGEEPRVIPPRNIPGANIRFSDFFDLCVVLWSHICKIDHWVLVAEYIREFYWQDDFRQWPDGRLAQWLFIGLVFKWRSVFEAASSALIVDYTKLDDQVCKADYLPPQVISEYTSSNAPARIYIR